MKVLQFQKPEKMLTLRAKANDTAEIIMYGPIGFKSWEGDGITAKEFSDLLSSIDPKVKEIVVRINSPGGDVFDGVAIYNRLKQHKARKVVYIDGMAASIASVIALAGDEINMGEGAQYMIHLPWTFAMGNRMDLENVVNRLSDVEELLLNIYVKKTKMERSELRKMLEDETWMDAKAAISHGFVDKEVEETMPIAASVFEKSTWLRRAPKNYLSEEEVRRQRVTELKNKIEGKLAIGRI